MIHRYRSPDAALPEPTRAGLAGVVASVVVGVVAGTAILGACSGGGGGGGTAAASVDNHEACARLDELDRGADAIAQVNVADPDQFRADFDRAVDRYVSALSKLRKVAPASLHEPIDELRRDVSRHDFADGAARARGWPRSRPRSAARRRHPDRRTPEPSPGVARVRGVRLEARTDAPERVVASGRTRGSTTE